MLRVGDLDRSIKFYKKAFGMELLRTRDNPEYKYTIAMMGHGSEDKNTVLELTYNYGVTDYEKGNGYAQAEIFMLFFPSMLNQFSFVCKRLQLAQMIFTKQQRLLNCLAEKLLGSLDLDLGITLRSCRA